MEEKKREVKNKDGRKKMRQEGGERKKRWVKKFDRKEEGKIEEKGSC